MPRRKKQLELITTEETTPLVCPKCKATLTATWSHGRRRLQSIQCTKCQWTHDMVLISLGNDAQPESKP